MRNIRKVSEQPRRLETRIRYLPVAGDLASGCAVIIFVAAAAVASARDGDG
jgi:hypothetical protein